MLQTKRRIQKPADATPEQIDQFRKELQDVLGRQEQIARSVSQLLPIDPDLQETETCFEYRHDPASRLLTSNPYTGAPLLAVDELSELFDTLARGLAAVHAAGHVHGGISPGAIVLTADGSTRFADLGVAFAIQKAFGPATLIHQAIRTDQADCSATWETVDHGDRRSDRVAPFITPTRFDSLHRRSASDDIYASGITLHLAATGVHSYLDAAQAENPYAPQMIMSLPVDRLQHMVQAGPLGEALANEIARMHAYADSERPVANDLLTTCDKHAREISNKSKKLRTARKARMTTANAVKQPEPRPPTKPTRKPQAKPKSPAKPAPAPIDTARVQLRLRKAVERFVNTAFPGLLTPAAVRSTGDCGQQQGANLPITVELSLTSGATQRCKLQLSYDGKFNEITDAQDQWDAAAEHLNAGLVQLQRESLLDIVEPLQQVFPQLALPDIQAPVPQTKLRWPDTATPASIDSARLDWDKQQLCWRLQGEREICAALASVVCHRVEQRAAEELAPATDEHNKVGVTAQLTEPITRLSVLENRLQLKLLVDMQRDGQPDAQQSAQAIYGPQSQITFTPPLADVVRVLDTARSVEPPPPPQAKPEPEPKTKPEEKQKPEPEPEPKHRPEPKKKSKPKPRPNKSERSEKSDRDVDRAEPPTKPEEDFDELVLPDLPEPDRPAASTAPTAPQTSNRGSMGVLLLLSMATMIGIGAWLWLGKTSPDFIPTTKEDPRSATGGSQSSISDKPQTDLEPLQVATDPLPVDPPPVAPPSAAEVFSVAKEDPLEVTINSDEEGLTLNRQRHGDGDVEQLIKQEGPFRCNWGDKLVLRSDAWNTAVEYQVPTLPEFARKTLRSPPNKAFWDHVVLPDSDLLLLAGWLDYRKNPDFSIEEAKDPAQATISFAALNEDDKPIELSLNSGRLELKELTTETKERMCEELSHALRKTSNESTEDWINRVNSWAGSKPIYQKDILEYAKDASNVLEYESKDNWLRVSDDQGLFYIEKTGIDFAKQPEIDPEALPTRDEWDRAVKAHPELNTQGKREWCYEPNTKTYYLAGGAEYERDKFFETQAKVEIPRDTEQFYAWRVNVFRIPD